MDAHVFDRLAQAMATGGPRRGIVRGLVTFPLAALMAAWRADDAVAGRRQRKPSRHSKNDHHAAKKQKSKGKKKCTKIGETVKNGRHCCPGLVEDGAARCAPPCGVTCTSGCCSGGVCQPGTSDDACGAGGIPCGVCPANQSCLSGQCACDVCPNGCAFSSIQAAIDAAVSGGTIHICAGRYDENVTVSKSVTLIGAGGGSDSSSNTIIDARNDGRVVTVDPGVTSTLQSLRLMRGFVSASEARSNGAGIRSEGRLTLIGCTVTQNTALTAGGILHAGPSLTMTDCEVSDNEASSFAGIYAAFGFLTMTNSRLTGNSAIHGIAGALAVELGARATLTGCELSGNSASDGGALHNRGILALDNTTIAGNSADQHGGGIFNDGVGVVALRNGTSVRSNQASPLPSGMGTGSASGGGIFAIGPVTLASGSSVTDNSPDNCIGLIC